MIIVIDSNILIQYKGFDSHSMQDLLDFAQKTNSYIYLHKIVIEEVSANITRDCAEATEKLNKELDRLSKWGAKIPAFNKEELEKPLLDKFINQVTIPNGASTKTSPESQRTNGFSQIIINSTFQLLVPSLSAYRVVRRHQVQASYSSPTRRSPYR